jgi:hypothetical protein
MSVQADQSLEKWASAQAERHSTPHTNPAMARTKTAASPRFQGMLTVPDGSSRRANAGTAIWLEGEEGGNRPAVLRRFPASLRGSSGTPELAILVSRVRPAQIGQNETLLTVRRKRVGTPSGVQGSVGGRDEKPASRPWCRQESTAFAPGTIKLNRMHEVPRLPGLPVVAGAPTKNTVRPTRSLPPRWGRLLADALAPPKEPA